MKTERDRWIPVEERLPETAGYYLVFSRGTVLDNCMGSGTTGVACVNTGRQFVGIELDGGFYNYARERIDNAQRQMRLEEAK